ncbi:hypothetical protein GOODEAATRI_020616, partial [Goodea atripinnis]
MDTPGLYIYTTHKLSQPHRHTLHLTSVLTASKWLTVRNLVLDGFYKDRGREKEARLEVYTPAATYVQVCSALIHTFSSDTFPSDSEVCVTVTSNQLPSSAEMEGDLHWIAKHNNDYHYQARGKLRVERQECKGQEALLAQVKGSRKNSQGLQLALLGNNLCVNASRHLENQGNGEIHVQLSHSFHLLNTTGVPADSSAKMNCTRVTTEERFSAHCFGNVANRPVEVRAFRFKGPHNRLCYSLSLSHVSLQVQAKGCYGSSGQKELRANLIHSSVFFLTYLGVPSKSGVRVFLQPGPQRATFRQNLTSAVTQRLLIMVLSSTPSQAQAEVENYACSFLVLANRLREEKESTTKWTFFAHQRCFLLKTLIHPQASANISVSHSGCVTNLSAGTILPQSLALQGLLSVTSCQVIVKSSLRADDEHVSLELIQSCMTPHLSGTITHSFHGLKSQGLPQIISMEATGPKGSDQAGAVIIKIGRCKIRARRTSQDRRMAHWLWASDTDCPVLQ